MMFIGFRHNLSAFDKIEKEFLCFAINSICTNSKLKSTVTFNSNNGLTGYSFFTPIHFLSTSKESNEVFEKVWKEGVRLFSQEFGKKFNFHTDIENGVETRTFSLSGKLWDELRDTWIYGNSASLPYFGFEMSKPVRDIYSEPSNSLSVEEIVSRAKDKLCKIGMPNYD